LLTFAQQDSVKIKEPALNDIIEITSGETEPEFPGGKQAMYQFIIKNVKYPQLAVDSNISGNVYVQFVVDTVGKISDVKVARGVHYLLDAEAVRVVKSMPNWIPGKIRGKAVKVRYYLPINFKLQ
jgi:protein TonB